MVTQWVPTMSLPTRSPTLNPCVRCLRFCIDYDCQMWPEPKALLSWAPTQSWPHGLFDFKEPLVVSGLILPHTVSEGREQGSGGCGERGPSPGHDYGKCC